MKDLHIGDKKYYLEIKIKDIDHIEIEINDAGDYSGTTLNVEDIIVLKSWLESWLIERQE